jgi:hypothetical protein
MSQQCREGEGKHANIRTNLHACTSFHCTAVYFPSAHGLRRLCCFLGGNQIREGDEMRLRERDTVLVSYESQKNSALVLKIQLRETFGRTISLQRAICGRGSAQQVTHLRHDSSSILANPKQANKICWPFPASWYNLAMNKTDKRLSSAPEIKQKTPPPSFGTLNKTDKFSPHLSNSAGVRCILRANTWYKKVQTKTWVEQDRLCGRTRPEMRAGMSARS